MNEVVPIPKQFSSQIEDHASRRINDYFNLSANSEKTKTADAESCVPTLLPATRYTRACTSAAQTLAGTSPRLAPIPPAMELLISIP